MHQFRLCVCLVTAACIGGSTQACDKLARRAERAAWRRGCDDGEATACYKLGVAHSEGDGVPKDPGRTADLFRRACDGGLAMGCHALGVILEFGQGVPKDVGKAAVLYRRACDGGHEAACKKAAGSRSLGEEARE